MISIVNEFLWTYVCLWLILSSGLVIFIITRGSYFYNISKLSKSFFRQSDHGISPFKALMTALSGTVGTGNIAGVAAAVYLGGPGVIFYIWVIGFFAIALKYAEGFLSIRYRINGRKPHGGPMYYMSLGVGGSLGRFLAIFFSISCLVASLGIGSSVQANSIAQVFETNFFCPKWITGLILMFATMIVVIGGVRRISDVAAKVVPAMILVYLLCSISVLYAHAHQIVPAFQAIIHHAFHGAKAVDGFIGASVWSAIYYGLARGIFSNEAGMGSSAIAHASSSESDPQKQGVVACLGTLVDTFFVCTLTGLVVVVSGAWKSGYHGAAMTAYAVQEVVPFGGHLIGMTLVFFGFSTILAWGLYSDAAIAYLAPTLRYVYRYVFLLAIFLGSVLSLDMVWQLADLFNGFMVIPNILAIWLLMREFK